MNTETVYHELIKMMNEKYKMNGLEISKKSEILIYSNSTPIIYEILNNLYLKASECRLNGEAFDLSDNAVEKYIRKNSAASIKAMGFGAELK